MRDPGRPRRNPFFEHDATGDADGAGMGFRDHEPGDAGDVDDPTAPVGGLGALLALVNGLADAQPDAAEHLVAAAHEVVLTVKVLVDATEAVLAEQRAGMAARREAAEAAAAEPAPDPTASAGSAGPVDASISPLRRATAP